jgi:hypothetical protein
MQPAEIFEKLSELQASQREMILLQKIQNEQLEKQQTTLERLTITVEQHEMRSTNQEYRVELMEKEMKPIQEHLSELRGVNKAIGIISKIIVLGTAIFGIVKAILMIAR